MRIRRTLAVVSLCSVLFANPALAQEPGDAVSELQDQQEVSEETEKSMQENEEQESTNPIEGPEETLSGPEGEWNSVEAEEQTSADLSGFTNTLENLSIYGTTKNSYLSKTDAGYQAVLVDAKIHILDFDSNWNQISEKTLDYELPIFGGFYSGQTYNYLVFGQSGMSAVQSQSEAGISV